MTVKKREPQRKPAEFDSEKHMQAILRDARLKEDVRRALEGEVPRMLGEFKQRESGLWVPKNYEDERKTEGRAKPAEPAKTKAPAAAGGFKKTEGGLWVPADYQEKKKPEAPKKTQSRREAKPAERRHAEHKPAAPAHAPAEPSHKPAAPSHRPAEPAHRPAAPAHRPAEHRPAEPAHRPAPVEHPPAPAHRPAEPARRPAEPRAPERLRPGGPLRERRPGEMPPEPAAAGPRRRERTPQEFGYKHYFPLDPRKAFAEAVRDIPMRSGALATPEADAELFRHVRDWELQRLTEGRTMLLNHGGIAREFLNDPMNAEERRRLCRSAGITEAQAENYGPLVRSKIGMYLYAAYAHDEMQEGVPQRDAQRLYQHVGRKMAEGKMDGPRDGWIYGGQRDELFRRPVEYRLGINSTDPRALDLLERMTGEGILKGSWKISGPAGSSTTTPLGDPARTDYGHHLNRSDPLVVYCQGGTDYKAVAGRITRAVAAGEITTREGTNLFTHEITRGVSIQQDPGPGTSFGLEAARKFLEGGAITPFTPERPNPLA